MIKECPHCNKNMILEVASTFYFTISIYVCESCSYSITYNSDHMVSETLHVYDDYNNSYYIVRNRNFNPEISYSKDGLYCSYIFDCDFKLSDKQNVLNKIKMWNILK